jgi:hypothetical protein
MPEAIEELKNLRGSDEIISYITGNKQPSELFATKIGMDVLDIFAKHLSKIGKKRKISLFLYTLGGILEAPWPLVSLIREYCKEFEVIIPSRCLSAGTLLCLGADKIVMVPSSFLSPIDPEGSYPVNGIRKSIQVEDVTGFLDFAKEKAGIIEQGGLVEMVKMLTNEIPASVLGSVNRTHSLIRMLANKMLKMHKDRIEEEVAREIIENLTAKLYSHKHLISRKEAKESIGFGDLIDYATTREENYIKNIFGGFSEEMELEKVFDPGEFLGENTSGTFENVRAIIKSSVGKDCVKSEYTITRNQPGSPQPFNIAVKNVGWKEEVQIQETQPEV